MSTDAKYAVGIDLGTTNSVIACIDLKEKQRFPDIQTVPILQRIDEDTVGVSDRLPSFLYYPTSSQKEQLPEFNFESEHWVIGMAAASMGRKTSGRLITSAKSWLCHERIDKTKSILPWGGLDDVPKLSPLKATQFLLQHLKYSWEQSDFGKDAPLNQQILTITLPASFDQAARELTLEACRRAGLEQVKLLEEPQAAFYNWISLRKGRWDEALGKARQVLICDIGGGTSDFSLVSCHKEEDQFDFKREAVGRHLLLGGDNMDLALAHLAEQKISGKQQKKLNQSQWQLLSQLTRHAKEQLLQDNDETSITLRLPGSGTKVIGGLRQTNLERKEIEEMIINGFFPILQHSDRSITTKSGLAEVGLPYEQEPAITWHILDFIEQHKDERFVFPDAILFNGGALEPTSIRERILELLNQHNPHQDKIHILESDSLANAVARGAAFYSYTSSRGGLKIGGGAPQAYYLELQGDHGAQHICVIPKGSEAHEQVRLQLEGLVAQTNAPVSFPLYQSDQYPLDEVGHLRLLPEELSPMGKLNTMVRFGKGESKSIPVEIHGELTELDTIRLNLKSLHTPHDWKLEFDLRQSHSETKELQDSVAPPNITLDQLSGKIQSCFQGSQAKSIFKQLEKEYDFKKANLNIPNLREISDALLQQSSYIDQSPLYEATWLNAFSYASRPGLGHSSDDLRRQKIWSLFRQGPHSGKDTRARSEWAILWRRIAPSIDAGKQNDLYQRNKKSLLDKKGLASFKGETAELWRTFASFEHLIIKDKSKLGQALCQHIQNNPTTMPSLCVWAIGRFGTRQPLYGGPDQILPATTIKPWINTLLSQPASKELALTLIELCRKSGDRNLDIDESLNSKVIDFLEKPELELQNNWKQAMLKPTHRELFQQTQLLGESLPVGLKLNVSS